MSQSCSYYKILGLEKNCNLAEIKKAYRELALKYHPDKCDSDSDLFPQIKDAYETLSDPEKRKTYDNLLGRNDIVQSFDFGKIFSFMVNQFANLNNDINLTINATMEEVYSCKVKRVIVPVRRWIDGSYRTANETIYIPLKMSYGKQFRFEKRGNESFMKSTNGHVCGDIIVVIQISDASDKVKFDDIFEEHTIYLDLSLSLHDFYLAKTTDLQLSADFSLPLNLTGNTSYCIDGKGLGVIYVYINRIIPKLNKKCIDDPKFSKFMKKYFNEKSI